MIEFIKRVRFGSNVQRYHTFPIIGEQNVGHHSHNVAVLAWHLALLDEDKTLNIQKIMQKALLHDIHEGVLGDLPTTTKMSFHQLNDAMNEAKDLHDKNFGLNIVLSAREELIVAWADSIEMICFATEQLHKGNTSAKKIICVIFTKLEAMVQLPQGREFVTQWCVANLW